MNPKEIIAEIVKNSHRLALATLNEAGHPSNRILLYAWSPETPERIFFNTAKKSPKVEDMKLHTNVSFTTIPDEVASHELLASNQAVVRLAPEPQQMMNNQDLQKLFTDFNPGYDKVIEKYGAGMATYEIEMQSAMAYDAHDKGGLITF